MWEDIAWTLGPLAVLVGMIVIAYRIEPHWIAKDASRFITVAQEIDIDGRAVSRRREVRVAFVPEGGLLVSRRALMRTTSKLWRVHAKSPDPPRGRAVYLLSQQPYDPMGYLLALRVPATSKVVGQLDALLPTPA